MPPSTVEILEWLRFGATIITPFAVMGLGMWLSARAASRKKLMESIDEKIEKLGEQIESGRDECRGDIRAIIVQVSAFQREVAERYPLRRELEEGMKTLRDDLRYYAGRPDDPHRRR